MNFQRKKLPRLLEYIDTRMQKFSKENLRIKTLRLSYSATELLSACKVDEWLEIAVRNQVAEIELERFASRAMYKLPRILFCAKSLRHLDIAKVEMPYYEAVDLVSLESLYLHWVVVEERMLCHIISSCLLLKELVLSDCSGLKNIVIPRRSKLESFQYNTSWRRYIDGGDVHVDGKVILETSSLISFQHYTYGMKPWPIISNRGLLTNLRFLSVSGHYITGEDFAKLLLELASLEKLELLYCQMLTSIKISHAVEFEEEEESGDAELGPPCDIRELKFELHNSTFSSSSSLSAFLNNLFWTCHPPLISLRVRGDSGLHKLIVEPLVNKLVDMVNYSRHPLKRIEVGETNNGSDFLDVQMRLYW